MWNVIELRESTAIVALASGKTISVFRHTGEGEWAFAVTKIEPSHVRVEAIEPLDETGTFRVTGMLDWEWPTSWADDWDETKDGPKVPASWSMRVDGIEFEVGREDSPDLGLALGQWITLHVSKLTLFMGEDEVVPYYRESGPRSVVDKLFTHLKASGCRSMWVAKVQESPELWQLSIRPQDRACAEQVAPSNLVGDRMPPK